MKNHKIFYCESCHYKCKYQRDWNRHILSAKHQIWENGNDAELKTKKKLYFSNCNEKKHICNCGKKYITQSGLWKHKKKCHGPMKLDITNNSNVTNMLFELIKSNQELQKLMLDLCKNGITVTNNNNLNNIHHTNSHNKTFNLQFFLNETCKDSMNILEFIDNIQLQLQLSDLENICNLGYVEGISNIIIDKQE